MFRNTMPLKMEYLKTNHEAIAWILLWAWIALTIFILAVSPRSWKVYLLNILLIVGFIYLKFVWK